MKNSAPSDHYYGASSPAREVSGLRLTERQYIPNFKTPNHSHAEAYFCLILDGTSTQTFGSKSRFREPLATLFYPPNEVQSESFGVFGSRIFNVEVDLRWQQYFRDYRVITDESIGFRGGSVAWLMTRLYDEFRRMRHASSLTIEGLTLEIIAEASRRLDAGQNCGAPWLEQVRDILHDRFAENLGLESIAQLIGVHPVHLASSFRRHYGCTVGDYRRRLRVEFACRELSKPNSSLAEIAMAAGFSNQPHFSRIFKRHRGVTPSQYRASLQRH